MAWCQASVTIIACCALLFPSPARAIDCYQCVSTDHTNPFQCNEFLSSDISIEPEPCDAVYGASFCVKHTGRFEAIGIDCFRCSAAEQLDCTDGLVHSGSLSPASCDDIYRANYCIKTTGRFGGGLGTKRFCSSLDLGNYCNYISQPGDVLQYRSCVYTCSSDGCNLAPRAACGSPALLLLLLLLVLATLAALP